MPGTLQIPIFPLGTVLYPEGTLPLRIFEQRYLDMTKVCIRDGAPFGVCLIREGLEVGSPAVPWDTGCTARITQWDMPHLGLFHLITQGDAVFRILEQWHTKSGLIQAQVELYDPSRHKRCRTNSSCSPSCWTNCRASSALSAAQRQRAWTMQSGSAIGSRSCCPSMPRCASSCLRRATRC